MIRKTVVTLGSLLLVAAMYLTAFGWGWDAHRFINRTAVYHLPNNMQLFIQDSSFFSLHSIDPDVRRNNNPNDTSLFAEGPRHFMDIDDYPNFHNLPHDLNTVIALYGWERVKNNGTNPWATVWNYDTLVTELVQGDWAHATLRASDIGHYVGDAHQPLHNTKNYNGQYTGNSGIHARYETTMLSPTYYLSALYIVPDNVEYVTNKIDFVFDYIFHTNSLVDTILHGDTYAKAASGGIYNATYYTELWNRTRIITLDQMQRGTRDLASLWYSAWVDAGLILPTGVTPPVETKPAEFKLEQNFPNPFNPTTTISYYLPVGGTISLKVFALDGREVATIAQENQSVGHHTVEFDASRLASGVYLYRLQLGHFAETKKMLLLK